MTSAPRVEAFSYVVWSNESSSSIKPGLMDPHAHSVFNLKTSKRIWAFLSPDQNLHPIRRCSERREKNGNATARALTPAAGTQVVGHARAQ